MGPITTVQSWSEHWSQALMNILYKPTYSHQIQQQRPLASQYDCIGTAQVSDVNVAIINIQHQVYYQISGARLVVFKSTELKGF